LAGMLLRGDGKPERVDALLGPAVDWLRRERPESLELARALGVLAYRRWAGDGETAAEPLLVEAIELMDRHAPAHPDAAQLRHDLAKRRDRQGRLEDAIALHRAARQRSVESLGARHLQSQRIGCALGMALGRRGDWREADRLLVDHAQAMLDLLPEGHADRAAILAERARLASLLDRLDEADALLDTAFRLADSRRDRLATLAESMRLHQAALRERQGDPQA